MAFKVLLYGSVSLIAIIAGLASLGSLMSILNQASEGISARVSSNLYCSTDSNCKQNPNDCTECVNIMVGGFNIWNKCRDNPIPCYCINNECTNSTAG